MTSPGEAAILRELQRLHDDVREQGRVMVEVRQGLARIEQRVGDHGQRIEDLEDFAQRLQHDQQRQAHDIAEAQGALRGARFVGAIVAAAVGAVFSAAVSVALKLLLG